MYKDPFTQLIDDVADRRDELDRQRAEASDQKFLAARASDMTLTKAVEKMARDLGPLLKSTNSRLVAAQRENKEARLAKQRARFSALNAQATALAASGQISGVEGAMLDNLIHKAAVNLGLGR